MAPGALVRNPGGGGHSFAFVVWPVILTRPVDIEATYVGGYPRVFRLALVEKRNVIDWRAVKRPISEVSEVWPCGGIRQKHA